MWITAAAFAMAKELNCPLYIPRNPPSHNPHNKGHVDYSQVVFRTMGTHVDRDGAELAADKARTWSVVIPPHAFSEWSTPAAPGVVLNSYFQYYPPLAPHETDLRAKFLEGLEACTATVRRNFVGTVDDIEQCAFLHVRRGDYMGLSHVYYHQPLTYYESCLEGLAKARAGSCKTVFVLSDDQEWCKAQPLFQTGEESKAAFVHLDSTWDELHTLALMALCRGGAICANSTFSWWGAFLGAYGARHPVYVPKLWIKTHEPSALFPSEWVVI
jgi:hypothetical protein